MKERLSLTPGTPIFTARRLENPEDKVNQKDHEIYRSGVGTLLYLTKCTVDLTSAILSENYQKQWMHLHQYT